MKKNNIKMTKNARIGIATMAAIMAMSLAAPLAANAASLRGYENRAAAGTEDNNDDGRDDDHGINTTDVTQWTISIIKCDDKMKTLLEASEKAVHGIVYKIPQIGYVAGPMFEMLKVLCESDEPETTLGSISKQLEGI